MIKKIIFAVIVLGILSFGWWTLSPLFITTEVQDELDPELAALLEEANDPLPTTPPIADSATSEVLPEPATEVVALPVTREAETTSEPAVSLPAETSLPAPDATPRTIVRGPFAIEDTPGHPAEGSIRVIDSPEKGSLVRFEDYSGTNGPDLRIYLATDLEATEFVDLGKAKGNMGNINYDIPADVDIDDYQYVLTWCRAFGVLFDYALIAQN